MIRCIYFGLVHVFEAMCNLYLCMHILVFLAMFLFVYKGNSLKGTLDLILIKSASPESCTFGCRNCRIH